MKFRDWFRSFLKLSIKLTSLRLQVIKTLCIIIYLILYETWVIHSTLQNLQSIAIDLQKDWNYLKYSQSSISKAIKQYFNNRHFVNKHMNSSQKLEITEMDDKKLKNVAKKNVFVV